MSPGVLVGRDAEVARLRAWVRQAVTALLHGEDAPERPDPDPPDVRSVASREFAVTEAIQDLIEQWCSTGPVALLLDDLQWADPASFLVLHRLGRTIGQVPLLMVVA